MDRALGSRSEDLGFDSHCWSCVEVTGKLLISCCLCPPNSDGYLVEQIKLICNVGRNALNFPQKSWTCNKGVFQYQRCTVHSIGFTFRYLDYKHIHLHFTFMKLVGPILNGDQSARCSAYRGGRFMRLYCNNHKCVRIPISQNLLGHSALMTWYLHDQAPPENVPMFVHLIYIACYLPFIARAQSACIKYSAAYFTLVSLQLCVV